MTVFRLTKNNYGELRSGQTKVLKNKKAGTHPGFFI
jgi:hypothetical protein